MNVQELKRVARKLVGSVRICTTMFMARMFGEYLHTGWHSGSNMEFDYVRYRWRGQEWIIPTTPVRKESDGVN